MEIELKINLSDTATPNVQKFYQVLFWEKKCIIIYSGIVISPENNKISPNFNLVLDYNTSDKSDKIEIVDLTDKFLTEENGWKAVWGENGLFISEHSLVQQRLTNGNNYKIDYEEFNKFINQPGNGINQSKYIIIHSDQSSDGSYKCLAKGINLNNNNKISQNDSNLPNYLNLVNFHKVIIPINEQSLNDLTLEYKISKERDFKVSNFSFYFILPLDHDLVSRSKLEYSSQGVINNPVENPFSGITQKNRNKYFKEWIEELNILKRNYFYLARENEIKSHIGELKFTLEISNTFKPIYYQIVWALILSIIVAYGMDFTRLGVLRDYFFYFPEINYFIVFIPLVIIVSRNIINFSQGKNSEIFDSPKRKNLAYWAVIISGLWFLSIFVIGASVKYEIFNFKIGLNKYLKCFTIILFFLSAIFNWLIFMILKFKISKISLFKFNKIGKRESNP